MKSLKIGPFTFEYAPATSYTRAGAWVCIGSEHRGVELGWWHGLFLMLKWQVAVANPHRGPIQRNDTATLVLRPWPYIAGRWSWIFGYEVGGEVERWGCGPFEFHRT